MYFPKRTGLEGRAVKLYEFYSTACNLVYCGLFLVVYHLAPIQRQVYDNERKPTIIKQ